MLKLAAFADEASYLVDEQIKAMKENGISLLEIRGVDGTNIADISVDKAKEVRKKLDDAGIKVWSLGSPYGKITLSDDFEKHLDSFKHGVELCEILGTNHIRMFSFYEAEGRKDEVFERLSVFAKEVKGTGIILCHENEKGIYGDIAKRCFEIHREFPEIKAVFDPANFIQSGQETKEAWEMLKPYVEYMHIKDALSDGAVVPAGCGVGNLPFLISQYKGNVLTVEPHLTVFKGFEKLEGDEKTKMGKYTYPDSLTAFKTACDAIKGIIGEE
jgi:sugar phosphate isomerase/epimerase